MQEEGCMSDARKTVKKELREPPFSKVELVLSVLRRKWLQLKVKKLSEQLILFYVNSTFVINKIEALY
jgi:hypothetical protein